MNSATISDDGGDDYRLDPKENYHKKIEISPWIKIKV